jgi:diguanylate cyclase (GGDEF)-like protein/PAS domain S-box-containing protein
MTARVEPDAASQDTGETLDLLRIMMGILQRFAGLSNDDLDQGINDTLAAIGKDVGVDRCYLFVVSEDGEFVSNSHEWCADGIAPEIDNLQQLPFDTIAWWRPRLTAGQSIYIPSVQRLPESRQPERELLDAQSIQSLLVVPLMGNDRLRGFLGFDSVRQQREWSDEAQLLLRAVADVLVGAMARQDVLEQLLAKERHFAALVQHSTDVLMVLDHRSCFHYLSPTASRLLDLPGTDGFEQSLLDHCHPSDREVVSATLAATRHGEVQTIPDFRVQTGKGEWAWLMGTARDLSADPAVGGIVINAREINDRKQVEQDLQLQATHDSLTGLPNRSLLGELLDHSIGRCRRSGDLIGILFIDLDHFKLINDAKGHRVGDQLLIDVAHRLRNAVRQEDTVARFGGDEFVAVLNAPAGQDSAIAQAAERLLSAFDEPFDIAGVERRMTASAGLAVSDGRATAEEVIGNADAAMYLAKESGRARLRYFDESLRERLMERVEMENDLSAALQREQLVLHYQPIFRTDSRALVGFEALLRWQRGDRGLVMPDQFIATSEHSGTILELGAWVLARACDQLRHWIDHHPETPVFMAVNVSPVQLRDPAFPELVRSMLERYGLPAERLSLEVTETALMDHRERSIETLRELKELGVQLAIDDFGTGHSSLAYLRDLPVTRLKIDRSFIERMGGTEQDHSIVAAIQLLAHEYRLQTVAEGVETAAQQDAVQALGCDMLQGFYLGKPEPDTSAESFFNAA